MLAEDHKSSAHSTADRISLNAQLYKNISYLLRSDFSISAAPQKAADVVTTKGTKVGPEKIHAYFNYLYLIFKC